MLSPPSSPYDHITKAYLQSFLLPSSQLYPVQLSTNVTRHTCKGEKNKTKQNRKKPKKQQFAKTEQPSQPDMAGMLELPAWDFKTAIINMLGTLIDTHRQYARTDLSKEMETLRTTKRSTADQKHCNRNEKCLLWAD